VDSIKHNELITKPTKDYNNFGTNENSVKAEPGPKENINIDIFDFDSCPNDDDEADDETEVK